MNVERPQQMRAFNNLRGGMKDDSQTYRPFCSLFVEDGKRQEDKTSNRERYPNSKNDFGHLA